MNALDRLGSARTLTREGRYEEALREHLWFHEHALEENQALAAVRLSYALADWSELAEVYPKARLALESIRDRETDALIAHAVGWEAFVDVASINETLGCKHKTYTLFKALAASNEKLAARCSKIALPSILEAGDFELAEHFLPDPAEDIRRWSRQLNKSIQLRKQSKYTPAPRIKAEIDIYATKVKQILAVLEGCGRLAQAKDLRTLAIASIQATTIRDAVIAALKPSARPLVRPGRTKATPSSCSRLSSSGPSGWWSCSWPPGGRSQSPILGANRARGARLDSIKFNTD